MFRFFFAACFLSLSASLVAKSGSTFPVNGTPDARAELHVFEGAAFHLADGSVVNDGHLVVRRGRIEAVGAGTFDSSEPPGATRFVGSARVPRIC